MDSKWDLRERKEWMISNSFGVCVKLVNILGRAIRHYYVDVLGAK